MSGREDDGQKWAAIVVLVDDLNSTSRYTLRRRFSGPQLQKGRCYMEPLLPRTAGPLERVARRSKKNSTEKTSDPPSTFCDISFLKNKLGLTLPPAEDILRSAAMVRRPKGKLITLADVSKRFSQCLEEARQVYEMSMLSMPNSASNIQVRDSASSKETLVTPPGSEMQDMASKCGVMIKQTGRGKTQFRPAITPAVSLERNQAARCIEIIRYFIHPGPLLVKGSYTLIDTLNFKTNWLTPSPKISPTSRM
ncbi:hypothetical protein PoB_001509500 [Plakobranchus ocellatus]|uniref:Uncharacterized protein n=1 Tax=Plakobranchus ocellatus TaxID=259542 RepID=A0AAV3Z068_9GAST|nr:hypothetical protein PoB_001509500 [Plakobranchus ocellatus]